MTPDLRVSGGGMPTAEQAAAIAVAAGAVISAAQPAGGGTHTAYTSPWWSAGLADALRTDRAGAR